MPSAMVFDTDRLTNTAAQRTFAVRVGKPVLLTAAGLALTESVPIFVRATGYASNPGACVDCEDVAADFVWSPNYCCGRPMELRGDNNQITISTPGVYMLGGPLAVPIFAGDVNISATELTELYVAPVGECCAPDDAGAAPSPAPEFDTTTLADPVTGLPVFVTLGYTAAGVPVSTAYNLDGTLYAGPISGLVFPDGADLESDAVEMCDNGTTFLRWIVKKNGAPTGQYFDTDFAGAPYVVNAGGGENPPILGACPISVPSVDLRVNVPRTTGILPIGTTYSLASQINPGNEVSAYSIMFFEDDGTIDGLAHPRGTYSWDSDENLSFIGLPSAVESIGRFLVTWVERQIVI